jgi:serine protease AprX
MHRYTPTRSARLWRQVVPAVAVVLLSAVTASAASGQGHVGKVSAKVRKQAKENGATKVDVLVRFRREPGLYEWSLIRSLGGQVRRQHRSRWLSVRVPAHNVQSLADSGIVDFVASDPAVSASVDVARATAGQPLSLPESELKGAGVTVAVIDSGVAAHPEIQTLVAAVDFTGGVEALLPLESTSDPNGHGTHVAGIIVGNGSRSYEGRLAGVAPEASLVSIRVLDAVGHGSASSMLAGLDWILANRDQYGIRVVNLSLGHPVYEPAAFDPLVEAVERLWDAGVVVVCSAGNSGRDGHGTISSPCNARKVISVGALNDRHTLDLTDDTVATYSSRGPTRLDRVAKPDLLAPGNRVVSARSAGSHLDMMYPERRVAGDPSQPDLFEHLEMSGTSMAAPMVAGTAVLMLQQDPALSPGTVKARLMVSARKAAVGDPFATGAGLLDILGALQATGEVADAPSPRVFPDSSNTLTVENTAVLWANADFPLSALWPSGVLWSEDTHTEDEMLTSLGALWPETAANAALWPEAALWAEASLWPECSLWSESVLWSEDLLEPSVGGLGAVVPDP